MKKTFSDYEPIFKLESFFEGCAGNPKIPAPLALQMFLENCFSTTNYCFDYGKLFQGQFSTSNDFIKH